MSEFSFYFSYTKTNFRHVCFGPSGIIEKIDGYGINPENSSTPKVSEQIPSGFFMSTVSFFKDIENKQDMYRGKEFCEFLREHAMKIDLNKLLTKEQKESHENAKICYICKEKFEN